MLDPQDSAELGAKVGNSVSVQRTDRRRQSKLRRPAFQRSKFRHTSQS